MSDETSRPRRAWQPEEELQEPLISDDTAAPETPSPRRGHSGSPENSNPFARPGSSPSSPVPSRSADPAPMIPAPVFPRSAGEHATEAGPAPRRSALSSNTPAEAEVVAESQPTGSWLAANKATLAKWAVAGVVGAIVVGLIAFFVARGLNAEPTVDPTTAQPSASASPSEMLPAAEVADLVVADDLNPIAPAAEWSTITTTQSQAEHTMRALCLSTTQTSVNPTHSLQRTVATAGEDKLAALHRIDAYATVDVAKEVLAERVAALSTCAEVPARMVRATTVNGMAEETFQVTIVEEDAVAKFHTVLLTRDGAALQIFDVARNQIPVEPEAAAQSLTRSQSTLADRQGAAGPTNVAAEPTVVPQAAPAGWLVPIDLPRVHPGTGRWTMTGPHPVDGTNMGCENMDLATEAGPTERQRSAYALTRDPLIPERFGIDELLFTFPTAEDAAVFVTKLGTNLRSCAERVLTAEIEEHAAVPARDAEGNALSSLVFTATQAISDTEKVTYQLIVSVATNKVAYTIVSATPEVQFTQEQLTELASRISVRASQLDS